MLNKYTTIIEGVGSNPVACFRLDKSDACFGVCIFKNVKHS